MSKASNSSKQIGIGEIVIEKILALFGIISIVTTIGIVLTLMIESIPFFQKVSFIEFFTGRVWSPIIQPQSFGILPILAGTLMIAVLSSLISIPLGLGSAIYLSEYAPKRVRKVLKPTLEILAGIPSIVYGYFALTMITPFLQKVFPSTEIFNAASAAIAIGIMTIPMVASLSEDSMNAIPASMRNGAYALGSTKFEVATKIVIPGAISGIASSFVLAISRAIGETMIVAIAAGSRPTLTANPLVSVQTMTGYIANQAMGDTPQGTIEYRTIFAVGLTLFVITFAMNLIARKIVTKSKEGKQ